MTSKNKQSSEQSIETFLTNLFDEWNKSGIQYLILRNYEKLPAFVGNDIDILLEPSQLKKAQGLLLNAGFRNGWRCHNVSDFACRAIWLFNIETMEQVHIDLMCGVKWHALQFANCQHMLKRRQSHKNFFIPNPVDEAVVSLMTRLIYAGYVKENYRDRIQKSAIQENLDMIDVLTPWIGKELAEKIIQSANNGEWEKIEKKVKSVRKQIFFTNMRNPFNFLNALTRDAIRLIRRWIFSPGLSVVFFGPDGCGKTSVAQELKLHLEKTFLLGKGLHCHWKPVRQKNKPSSPNKNPHGLPPRSKLRSFVYFTYHYLPFIWGWWRTVKPVLFKSGLVIIDRYYYDFFIDIRRYRLNLPKWIIKTGFVFVKKPDLAFCLDASPDILQSRKKEVTFDECARQREEYRKLAKKLSNGYVIDASKPLEHVVADVQRIVLEYMAKRTAKQLRDQISVCNSNINNAQQD
jgi:thymidylate kinase